MKTPTQRLLEVQRGKDIREIMVETLEKFRATRTMIQDCMEDLGVSYGTFYVWAKYLNIEISDYHFAEASRK